MNLNNIPIKNKSNFYREESNNRLLIIPGGADSNSSLIIDETGKCILDLCNSKNTVNDIINLLKIKFDENDTDIVKNDVEDFLNLMMKSRVIDKFKECIMYTGVDIYLNDNLKIHRCGEGDIERIFNIVNSSENKIQNFENLIAAEPNNRSTVIARFNKLKIRNDLFKFSHEYYILVDTSLNKDLAMLSLSDCSNKKINIYEIVMLNLIDTISQDLLNSFINKSISNLLHEICPKCSKIKFNVTNNVDNNIIETLSFNLFNQVGVLKNEYGQGIDKILFEKNI